jgi:hypothetical protein
VGGAQFRLEVYPGGVGPEATGHVSMFLTSPAQIAPNQILHELSIVDQAR